VVRACTRLAALAVWGRAGLPAPTALVSGRAALPLVAPGGRAAIGRATAAAAATSTARATTTAATAATRAATLEKAQAIGRVQPILNAEHMEELLEGNEHVGYGSREWAASR